MTKLSWFGVLATVGYFCGLAYLVSINWAEFLPLTPNELGDFLAGSLGPLAIFWIVLGFFQQGHELRNSVEALRIQSSELRNSVEQQTALVEITEKQHKLQIEEQESRLQEMEKENERRERARLEALAPKVYISFGGGSGGETHTAKFILKNRGGDARKVSLRVCPDVERVTPETKGSLLKGDEFALAIITQSPIREFKELALYVALEGEEGVTRTQVFNLTVPQNPEILSDDITIDRINP